ncbi:MAG TPA: glycosyltransferase [Anaerolineae bacterium]|nr:glycosyltransferase [Anaerolineae bacterium]
MAPLRILFISPYIPSPIRVRPYNLIKYLAKLGHEITLLALVPPGEDTASLETLNQWCRSVKTVPLPRWRTLWNATWAVPSGLPLQAAYSRSPEMAELIRTTQQATKFDVVHIEHLRGSELSSAVNGTPIVFDSVDSITLLFEHTCTSGPNWQSRLMARLDLARTRRYEASLLSRYPRVLVTSPKDRDALVSYSTVRGMERFAVLPNGVDLEYFKPMDVLRDSQTLVLTGKMSYHANIAAALDVAQHVMPLVWQQFPEAQFVIAGKDPASEIQTLAADHRIIVTGTVPDLRPYLATSTLAVSPMRYGVGIQNKILEAMAMKTPVITTSKALSSLQVRDGNEILVADTPQAVAEKVVGLFKDQSLARCLGEAGRRYVENYHDWNVTVRNLEVVYRSVMQPVRNGHLQS